MFFPDRIRSIRSSDRVLDIGPGSMPHPSAHVYLEKRFASEGEANAQRGHAPYLADPGRTVFYDGGAFPFKDKEFDYVVCSHVLEHVADVEQFVAEVVRVARGGYFEFPTIYYDYVYDFPEHVNLLLFRENVISWMPKAESLIPRAKCITRLFYESMRARRVGLVDDLAEYLFQGFEWAGDIGVRRVTSIETLTYPVAEVNMPELPLPRSTALHRLRSLVGRWTRKTGLRRAAAARAASERG